MKRTFAILFLLAAGFVFTLNAQTQPLAKTQILKPVFMAEDVVFAFQALDNVEIAGSEVEAFLEVKNILKTTVQTIQTTAKQPTETIQVDINIMTAQNLITFLQRAKLTGKNAEQYKRFVEAIVESSKTQPK